MAAVRRQHRSRTGLVLSGQVNGKGQPAFERYIGIDYSGAATPTSSLTGLRVSLDQGERAVANVEGWILGVGTRP